MKGNILARATSAVVIGALALLVPGGSVSAQRGSESPTKAQHRSVKGAQQRNRRPADARSGRQARLPQDQQRQRVDLERQRTTQFREHLRDHDTIARQRAEALRQQNRLAHYRFQQRYDERLRQERRRLEARRAYDYYRDPYVYTPLTYRYARGGTYYQTNRYGANMLRQALNYGYAEGYRAGQADRSDRWRFGYEDSYAYLDANYGYPGYYVDQSEYNYYFREGFRRGYEDGYYGRHQYGRVSGTTLALLATVVAGIIVLEAID
jgi:hypothetical protein